MSAPNDRRKEDYGEKMIELAWRMESIFFFEGYGICQIKEKGERTKNSSSKSQGLGSLEINRNTFQNQGIYEGKCNKNGEELWPNPMAGRRGSKEKRKIIK